MHVIPTPGTLRSEPRAALRICIRAGGPDHPAVQQLLREHLQGMAQLSPAESIHALDLTRLQAPGIAFWSAWHDESLLGCAALKALGDGHGEIKSMRTAAAYLRRGVAAALLGHLIDEARVRGWTRLSLETGTAPAFEPAHRLYRRFGFQACEPFGDYTHDPHSCFMTRRL